MPKNQDALFRQWHMLRRVPRYPQKVTAKAIRDALGGEGFEVTERTIQRDLAEMAGIFPCSATTERSPMAGAGRRMPRASICRG